MDFVIAAQVLFVIAILLCLHHGWHHLHDDPRSHAKQESCMAVCYFQPSDVGNFRTCNHEMWILLCIFLAASCLVLSRLEVESV